MCANSEQQFQQSYQQAAGDSLRACLVDGDAGQLASERQRRRRSLIASVLVQIAALGAIILVPLLSKTERIAFAKVMPMPPYHSPASPDRVQQHAHPPSRTPRFSFCLTCAPTITRTTRTIIDTVPGDEPVLGATGGPAAICLDCQGLTGKTIPPPIAPRDVAPRIVHVTRIDPAMLIHRVEPIFPTLARQTGRAGHVELQAIIGTDGAVRSLQFLGGDALFYQSALEAVRQWRYKPTILNGVPVEVDTHITVIYSLNHN